MTIFLVELARSAEALRALAQEAEVDGVEELLVVAGDEQRR